MELYDKWRHMIPVEKRKEYKYFDVPPPEGIRKKVKENKKESKATRDARSASDKPMIPGAHPTPKAHPKKAKAKAKPKSKKGII